MANHRIADSTPLLDAEGNVFEPGYCEYNRYIYSRQAIKAHPLRIKEWDFYQISDERYTVQITFADISMGAAANFTLFDRLEDCKYEAMVGLSLLSLGNMKLPEDANLPHKIERSSMGSRLSVTVVEGKRYLHFEGKIKGQPSVADIELEVPSGLQSLTMAVPFEENRHFYLNQKMNCMPASGYVKIGDSVLVEFNPQTAFCVLDWGRGVWPYKTNWYWGNGSHRLEDGKVFGFEIGWGFGDMTAASENMLFYEGKGHKIGNITLNKDDSNYLGTWFFSSDDGRFEMTMTPEYDNYTSSRVGLIGNRCHQVFGKWNGRVVLDDGKVLEIKNMTAFTEFCDNRW